MKIALLLNCSVDFGGAERRLLRVFNEIAKTHRVFFVARSCTKDDLRGRLKRAACEVDNFEKVVCCSGDRSPIDHFGVFAVLARTRPGVTLMFDSSRFNYGVTRWLHFLGKHVVLTIANSLYYYEACRGASSRQLEALLKRVDHVDLLYPAQREYYQELVRGRTPITITPGTFTNLDLFRPQTKQNTFVFLAARLTHEKNPSLVLDAAMLSAQLLRKRGYRVIVCGRGWEEESLRKKISSEKMDDVIEMPGYVESHDILPAAKVLFAVGMTDNYPSQTIAEAAASGCFVIATDVGETRAMLNEEFSAIVRLDARELADRMREYIELSEDDQAKRGRAAREYAESHFAITESVEYFTTLCEEFS